MFDEAGERETLVAGKSPYLTRGGGDASDCADHGEDDEHRGHDNGTAQGVGRLVEDLDDGNTGLGRGGETEDVVLPVGAQAGAKSDEHDEAETGVAEGCPHHC